MDSGRNLGDCAVFVMAPRSTYRYNANTGDYPELGDRVKIVFTNSYYDGLSGTAGGFYEDSAVIVALDDPLEDGSLLIVFTIVCLDKIPSHGQQLYLYTHAYAS